jgi:hypothetical protein
MRQFIASQRPQGRYRPFANFYTKDKVFLRKLHPLSNWGALHAPTFYHSNSLSFRTRNKQTRLTWLAPPHPGKGEYSGCGSCALV